jgi:hypothetical protein
LHLLLKVNGGSTPFSSQKEQTKFCEYFIKRKDIGFMFNAVLISCNTDSVISIVSGIITFSFFLFGRGIPKNGSRPVSDLFTPSPSPASASRSWKESRRIFAGRPN